MDQALLRLVGSRLAELQRERVDRYVWLQHARPDQIPAGEPGSNDTRKNWPVWMKMAGRGNGKTRLGAEWIRSQVIAGRRRSVALAGPTLDTIRKLMIEGPSGIRTVSPPHEKPRFIERKRELHWPNGAIGYVYTSEEPENFRGPEHDAAWCEELGSWRNSNECWNNLALTMRKTGPLGDRPQRIVTTTPRPTRLIKELVADSDIIISKGRTFDNAANLDPHFLAELMKLKGTRLGDQELEGILLGDTPGALFKLGQIERDRLRRPPELLRVVVAVDPAVADPETRLLAADDNFQGAEVGIVVMGIGRCLCHGTEAVHGFVLEDLSGPYGAEPEKWAKIVVNAYHRHQADRIVAEVNNGGALVGSVLRANGAQHLPYRPVHASRGKVTRAEPVAALNDRGQIHHIGVHKELEDQMTTWEPLRARKSPDRMDAYVWAATDLMLAPGAILTTQSRVPLVHVGRRV